MGRRDSGTGSIYKDGDGYRVAILTGYDSVTGKPQYRKVRVQTHAEAVDTLKRMQVDAHRGQLTAATGVTVADYLQHWLETKIKPLKAPKTYEQYAWTVRDHILPNLGKKMLDKVTRPEVQALIGAKSQQTVKPRTSDPSKVGKAPAKTLSRSTLYRIRAVLHAAYENAIKDGLVGRNPCTHVELPTEAKARPVFLSPQEASALLTHAKSSDIPELLSFLLVTGTRISEALGIRWDDVDLKAGRVEIRGQLQRVNSALVRRETTKTSHHRTLPLSASIVAALKALKAKQMVEGLEDPDRLVFLNPFGRRLDIKYVSGKLKGVCRQAGIPEISPHKLRHTAATLALAETGDLHAVQKMLGHQQVALTVNLYGHATAETLRSVTNAIERAIKNGS